MGDYTSEQNSYTILGNALVSDVLSQSGVSLLASKENATSAMTPAEAAQKGDRTLRNGKPRSPQTLRTFIKG